MLVALECSRDAMFDAVLMGTHLISRTSICSRYNDLKGHPPYKSHEEVNWFRCLVERQV